MILDDRNTQRILAKRVSGIWFFGLAGSGKSHASNIISEASEMAFLVDGDDVREYVSPDLAYDLASREIQIRRILGISMLAIKNGYFPIASSVYMNEETLQKCNVNGIVVIQIERPFEDITPLRDIYKNSSDVVGKDIKLPNIETRVLQNDGSEVFRSQLLTILGELDC